jgi:hypothetical protein
MEKLFEFYEMVSLNDAALLGSERMAILKARLALNIFKRAMEGLKMITTEAPPAAEASQPIAASPVWWNQRATGVPKVVPNSRF